MSTFEKCITHAGLNAYRLVRGQSRGDVELKARLQLAQWEQRWHVKERAEANRRNHFAGKGAALERTLELEQQREALTRLLSSAVKARTTLDWENLKPRSPFATPPPTAPELEKVPSPPSSLPEWVPTNTPLRDPASQVIAVLTARDRLLPFLRKRKVAEAEAETRSLESEAEERYKHELAAHDERLAIRDRDEKAFAETQKRYLDKLDQVNRNNNAKNTSYYAAVQEWQKAKQAHLNEQQEIHKQIDDLRANYLAAESSAVKAYVYEVLAKSFYPDSFPRGTPYRSTTKQASSIRFRIAKCFRFASAQRGEVYSRPFCISGSRRVGHLAEKSLRRCPLSDLP